MKTEGGLERQRGMAFMIARCAANSPFDIDARTSTESVSGKPMTKSNAQKPRSIGDNRNVLKQWTKDMEGEGYFCTRPSRGKIGYPYTKTWKTLKPENIAIYEKEKDVVFVFTEEDGEEGGVPIAGKSYIMCLKMMNGLIQYSKNPAIVTGFTKLRDTYVQIDPKQKSQPQKEVAVVVVNTSSPTSKPPIPALPQPPTATTTTTQKSCSVIENADILPSDKQQTQPDSERKSDVVDDSETEPSEPVSKKRTKKRVDDQVEQPATVKKKRTKKASPENDRPRKQKNKALTPAKGKEKTDGGESDEKILHPIDDTKRSAAASEEKKTQKQHHHRHHHGHHKPKKGQAPDVSLDDKKPKNDTSQTQQKPAVQNGVTQVVTLSEGIGDKSSSSPATAMTMKPSEQMITNSPFGGQLQQVKPSFYTETKTPQGQPIRPDYLLTLFIRTKGLIGFGDMDQQHVATRLNEEYRKAKKTNVKRIILGKDGMVSKRTAITVV